MIPKTIPDDINVEILLSYFPQGSCKVVFEGLHKRNAYNDLIGLEENEEGNMLLSIGRASLYNSLPETMFHAIDRFDNPLVQNNKERFEEEYEAQRHEIENAHKYFSPIDLMLLQLRMSVRNKLTDFAENDIMIDIIGDEFDKTQRQNRFIKQVMPFLPFCKSIRGNKTLITLMLRKIFKEEGLEIHIRETMLEYIDPEPRYNECLGNNLDNLYNGNIFNEQTTVYEIEYWPDDVCKEDFDAFVKEVEVFRLFIQDYFMAIDETLHFLITCNGNLTYLEDETQSNYLNYNTYLL